MTSDTSSRTRRSVRRWIAPLAVGVSSVAASIVVPSLIIGAWASLVRDAGRVA
ncbi:MAG TPA: hypothetical protein VF166_11010 [Gemmatimonadaceae bacterium]